MSATAAQANERREVNKCETRLLCSTSWRSTAQRACADGVHRRPSLGLPEMHRPGRLAVGQRMLTNRPTLARLIVLTTLQCSIANRVLSREADSLRWL